MHASVAHIGPLESSSFIDNIRWRCSFLTIFGLYSFGSDTMRTKKERLCWILSMLFFSMFLTTSSPLTSFSSSRRLSTSVAISLMMSQAMSGGYPIEKEAQTGSVLTNILFRRLLRADGKSYDEEVVDAGRHLRKSSP